MSRTLIAIPAWNEAETIAEVLRQLKEFHPIKDVVVINDGSTDQTEAIARSEGVRVITHPINLGVGGALGTAFKYASTNNYERVIQLDADGQHRPEFLADLLEASANFDVVIGSRFARGGKFQTTGLRRAAMRIIGWSVSTYTKTKLTDVTSGFRVSGPRAVALFSAHYPVEYLGDTVESVILAAREGLTVSEIPVVMNERAGGLPSQTVFKAGLYTARIFMIILLSIFKSTPPSVQNSKRKMD